MPVFRPQVTPLQPFGSNRWPIFRELDARVLRCNPQRRYRVDRAEPRESRMPVSRPRFSHWAPSPLGLCAPRDLSEAGIDPCARMLENLFGQFRIIDCPGEDDGADHGGAAPDRCTALVGLGLCRNRTRQGGGGCCRFAMSVSPAGTFTLLRDICTPAGAQNSSRATRDSIAFSFRSFPGGNHAPTSEPSRSEGTIHGSVLSVPAATAVGR